MEQNHTLTNTKIQNGIQCLEPKESFKEIIIPVPWGHISGKWWGDQKKQPVIALHGWQDNAGSFDTLAPLLCKRIPILCIDLPGHGYSSPYPTGQYYYLFWDGIHVLRRIVKHYGFEKIKCVGHSLGGAIIFLYAASYPNDIDGYVSIDIASPSVRDPIKIVSSIGDHVDKFLKYEKMNFDNFSGYSWNDCIELALQGYQGSVTKESCKILLKRGTQEIKRATQTEGEKQYHFTRDPRLKVPALGFLTQDQVEIFASKIVCKVMNIRADPGMTFHNPESYDKVLDVIEKSSKKMVRIKVKGTHHVHLNEPEKVSQEILDFFLGE